MENLLTDAEINELFGITPTISNMEEQVIPVVVKPWKRTVDRSKYQGHNFTVRRPSEVRAEALKESIHRAARSITSVIVSSIAHQEDEANRIVTECEIIQNGHLYEVWAKSSCDGWAEDVKMLFSYYPDELTFSSCEFIGRSEQYAHELFHSRDIAYLRR